MKYTIENISFIVGGRILQSHHETVIEHLLIDSRKGYSPPSSLFFALRGPLRNGHQFIAELYKKGVKNFIISERLKDDDFADANFILVNDTLEALQRLTAFQQYI